MGRRVHQIEAELDGYKQASHIGSVDSRFFFPRRPDEPGPSAFLTPADSWPRVEVQIGLRGQSRDKLGDCVHVMVGEFLLSARAREALSAEIGDTAEWLPIHAKNEVYYWPRVRNTVDCLDEAASDCEYYKPGEPDIRTIHRYVFRESLIPMKGLFWIPQKSQSVVLATEGVVEAAQRAKLTGFNFTLVYPTDPVVAAPAADNNPQPVAPVREDYPEIKTLPLPAECGDLLRGAREWLGGQTSSSAITSIADEVDTLRRGRLTKGKLADASGRLGARLAVLLAGELRWEITWAALADNKGLAVLSADRKFAAFPVAVVAQHLRDRGEANTLKLMFNMLKAGTLPSVPKTGTKCLW